MYRNSGTRSTAVRSRFEPVETTRAQHSNRCASRNVMKIIAEITETANRKIRPRREASRDQKRRTFTEESGIACSEA